MGRQSKILQYNLFNNSSLGFGRHSVNEFRWQERLGRKGPLVLELGCGKAEFSLEMARRHPEKRFIAVDVKADRLHKGCKATENASIKNLVFIQANILDLAEYLQPASVDFVWLTFPDPYPKKSQAKHRMLNYNFLDVYKTLLVYGGTVNLKTDNQVLFEWTLELLSARKDVRFKSISFDTETSFLNGDDVLIPTAFEQKYRALGVSTKYLSFSFE